MRGFGSVQVASHLRFISSRGIKPSSSPCFFFAADRAADLSGLKAVDTWCFPDNSGFLIIHIWTKSLKSMDANVFAFENDGVKTQLYALLKVWKCICILVGSSE